MIELFFSFLVTVVPDYLYRKHKQGKRLGQEITLYNVWYELRWGITACAVLAITLITVIFFYHPTTNQVTSLFRTVTILSDMPGRVEAVYVENNQAVQAGDPIFRLDTTRQRAAALTARARIAEIEAALALVDSELEAAEGNIRSARGTLAQAEDELRRREAARARNRDVISEQEIAALQANVEARLGAVPELGRALCVHARRASYVELGPRYHRRSRPSARERSQSRRSRV